ncbi:hypothetical protein ACN28S_38875 [Cystobacter fuscus]
MVEFSLLHPGDTSGPPRPLMEGDEAEVRLRMTDASSGLPLPGLSPSAWMDLGHLLSDKADAQQECKDRVGVYLKGTVGIRPLIDLNSYYLLVLNKDPSLSVIDPVVGMTGKTSLYTTVVLERPGADWVKSLDQEALRLHAEGRGGGGGGHECVPGRGPGAGGRGAHPGRPSAGRALPLGRQRRQRAGSQRCHGDRHADPEARRDDRHRARTP